MGRHSACTNVLHVIHLLPGVLACCSLRMALQVFCGITSRVWQFSDILRDAKQHLKQQQQQQHCIQNHQAELQQQEHSTSSTQQSGNAGSSRSWYPCQAILGDLNTMAHSVARLSPNYCCDGMRWRSLGLSEAVWWQRNVLAVMGAY